LTAGAEGHKGLVNHLLFHPETPWLVGGGGGGDNGFLAFWKMDAVPEGAAEQKDAGTGRRAKADGHYHRLALSPTGQELYAAGYRKLDVWALA
jgi:hypothetical protein